MQFATFFKPSTGYVACSIPPRFDGERVPVEALLDGMKPSTNRL